MATGGGGGPRLPGFCWKTCYVPILLWVVTACGEEQTFIVEVGGAAVSVCLRLNLCPPVSPPVPGPARGRAPGSARSSRAVWRGLGAPLPLTRHLPLRFIIHPAFCAERQDAPAVDPFTGSVQVSAGPSLVLGCSQSGLFGSLWVNISMQAGRVRTKPLQIRLPPQTNIASSIIYGASSGGEEMEDQRPGSDQDQLQDQTSSVGPVKPSGPDVVVVVR